MSRIEGANAQSTAWPCSSESDRHNLGRRAVTYQDIIRPRQTRYRIVPRSHSPACPSLPRLSLAPTLLRGSVLPGRSRVQCACFHGLGREPQHGTRERPNGVPTRERGNQDNQYTRTQTLERGNRDNQDATRERGSQEWRRSLVAVKLKDMRLCEKCPCNGLRPVEWKGDEIDFSLCSGRPHWKNARILVAKLLVSPYVIKVA